ncbi:amidohydrolase family protein [Streptomyces malaysiensis]|uniref:amidohydrolase family protein n=1 Tax=Streptomyces malaysiensis TaxID=92644 RepID=UPI0031BBACC1
MRPRPDTARSPAAAPQGSADSQPRRERYGCGGRRPTPGPLPIAVHSPHVVTKGRRGRAGKSCGHGARRHHGLRPIGRPVPRRPAYDDFFSAAAELGQPVFIHPQLPPASVRDASYRGFDSMTDLALATFGWGWHLDTAIAALRLVLRGTFDRHPDLRVVLGHWGEMLLFWLDRVDSLSRIAGLERSVSDYVRSNFSITTSGMLNPALLRHALSVTSVDRLIFSTDYPFQRPTREEIDSFLNHFSTDAEREQFSSANAASLYGIDFSAKP